MERGLDRALRGEPSPGADAAGGERRSGGRGQRAVGVSVELRDRVGDRGVAVKRKHGLRRVRSGLPRRLPLLLPVL